MLGREALMLQGFPKQMIEKACAEDPLLTNHRLMDLAGNAFCAGTVAQVVMAALASLDLSIIS